MRCFNYLQNISARCEGPGREFVEYVHDAHIYTCIMGLSLITRSTHIGGIMLLKPVVNYSDAIDIFCMLMIPSV